ncbi:SusC/RagA family TonB-linked outer membrane protein, partial [Mariniphaga sediminis]|uniref:SusC/RagA family TonB-linked outer membrane protein n=1 Tax=Mariniphaga sediminis TaxID=1628158 RepID=UPI003569D927
MKKKSEALGVLNPRAKKLLLIMRLSIFLVLISVLASSASVYSQATKLTVKMKNCKIADVFDAIEQQSDFYFFYSRDNFDDNRLVSVDIEGKTVEKILDEIFEDQAISYEIVNKNILIKTTNKFPATSDLQQKTVSGTVSDKSGQPLPGVTVIIKGTSQGTVTDADGKYSLSNIPEDATLVFSFVGMKPQEIIVGNQTSIDISMEVDAIGLEEVVAIGYGTMKKSDLTGSVVSADIEAFRESPNVNIMQSLQGSVPGIQIGQVDQAGEEPSIQIRGVNTLSGNKNPLIVVDGIIYRGRIGDLNPSDIQSIEILKDASSKAIYGSQAANGVILITTKSGKKSDKPMFHYSGSVSFQNPTVDARLLNREENLEKIKGIYYTKAYLAPDYSLPNPDFDWATQTELVPALLDGIENGTDFDWYKELTSPAFITDHLLSINGGTDKTNYYISGGYTKQDGYVTNDHYERYTTRINFKNDITSWLTIGINTFGSFTDFSGIGPGWFVATSPFVTPYDENGELIIYPKGESTTHLNPLLNIQADNKQVGNNISGLFYGDIKIPQIEGLTYRINYNKSLVWSENATGNKYGAGLTGTVNKAHASNNEETLDNILTYEKQINAHSLKTTLVYGYRKAKYDNTNASGQNIPNISLSYNSLQQAIIQQISSGAWSESSLYQMARLNYNYKNKY